MKLCVVAKSFDRGSSTPLTLTSNSIALTSLPLKGIHSMPTLVTIAVSIVALIHISISVVEMFFWETPIIYERLGFTAEIAHQVGAIVQNAGLYNSFIAAGLLWSLFTQNHSLQTKTFFLICALIAGIFGGITLSPNTLVLQTLPALLALILVWSTRKKFSFQPD
jgi:putative membrane protein